MDEREYDFKVANLRIIKTIKEYLKTDGSPAAAVYPIVLPEEFLYRILQLQGVESTDQVINHIFKLGLSLWSDSLYHSVFGSERGLIEFIKAVNRRNEK